jgi:hypothetical protein
MTTRTTEFQLPPTFVFHPIAPDCSDGFLEHTEVTCCSSDSEFSSSGEVFEVENVPTCMMELTPYPYATTSEEIEDWRQLEASLGEAWSLQVADEISCAEMSIDSDDEEEPYPFCRYDDETVETKRPQHPQEPKEVTAKRNLLWKQSLKTSMFKAKPRKG